MGLLGSYGVRMVALLLLSGAIGDRFDRLGIGVSIVSPGTIREAGMYSASGDQGQKAAATVAKGQSDKR